MSYTAFISSGLESMRFMEKLFFLEMSNSETGKWFSTSWFCDMMSSYLFFYFISRYGISPENIILYGQSIGTVPTVDLASRYECAAVVLHSPLTSGMRVAFPDTKKTYCFDAFPK